MSPKPSRHRRLSHRGLSAWSILPAVAALLACGGPEDRAESPPTAPIEEPAAARASAVPEDSVLRDITAETGLDFEHWNGRTGGYFYSEMMGAGGALVDVDLDGDLDLFLIQGVQLDPDGTPEVPEPAHGLGDRLYRNDLEVGDDGEPRIRFVDITEQAGLNAVDRGYGMGVTVTDVDGDGYPDLYVTRAGANQLLRHRGGAEPAYEDWTDSVTGITRWGVPAVSFDLEGDGDLDLFIGHYVDYSTAVDKSCTDALGQANYCGPLAYPSVIDELLINLGPGPDGRPRFELGGGRAGFAQAYGPALGATLVDLELDGLLDIFVANDGNENQLWHNRGDGTFGDRALELGVAVNGQGHAEAGMGVAGGDVDNDGDEDLLVTHLTRETHTLYVRDAAPKVGAVPGYVDRTRESGLAKATFAATGFGAGLVDFDHDGQLDAVAVSGAVKVIKELALRGDPYPLHQKNLLLRGVGGGRFEPWPSPSFEASRVSRGALFGDLDNDGDVDLVITNNSGPARVLANRVRQNPQTAGRPWLGLALVDGAGSAVPGAYAELILTDGRRLVRRVGANASYASSGDPRLHFTFPDTAGDAGDGVPTPETLDVLWPGGRWERYPAPALNTYTELRRGGGEPRSGDARGDAR
ncbi:MAG: FG-GAP-like repeat-containing protein [Acidobacteriota bacterium]